MTTSPFLRSFLFPGQKPAVVFIGKKLHGKEHEGASATDRAIVRLRPLLIHVGVTDDRIQHFQQVQQASMKGSVSDGVQNREKKSRNPLRPLETDLLIPSETVPPLLEETVQRCTVHRNRLRKGKSC